MGKGSLAKKSDGGVGDWTLSKYIGPEAYKFEAFTTGTYPSWWYVDAFFILYIYFDKIDQTPCGNTILRRNSFALL